MILFLDYDGVLHPGEVFLERGKPVLRCEGHTLFEHAGHLAGILAQQDHVRIVLSTSWVSVFRDFDKVKGFLPQVLQDRVIGATWHSKGILSGSRTWSGWSETTRYEQIAGYVMRHRLVDWIAIDDDDYGWPQNKRCHLVHTDAHSGLGDDAVLNEIKDKLEWR